MDPETLLTFIFRVPHHVRTVELLGSWDNFTHSYRMHHDRRRGTGFWTGCFKFENIIFDGDQTTSMARSRSGGLKQGGVYWYYYRLDDEVEAYDDSVPASCTAQCPLMPGQWMNVVHVPREVTRPVSRRRSAPLCQDIEGTLAAIKNIPRHTLEPADKYAMAIPPGVERGHMRSLSDMVFGTGTNRAVTASSSFSISRPVSRRPGSSRGYRPAEEDGTRKASTHFDALPAAEGSCHRSVLDVYSADLPVVVHHHPHPLASSPVHQDVRTEPHRGVTHFDFGFRGQHGPELGEEHARSVPRSGYSQRHDSASTYSSQLYSAAKLPSSVHGEDMGHEPLRNTYPDQKQGVNLYDRDHHANYTYSASPSYTYTAQHEQLDLVIPSPEEVWSPTFSADTMSSTGGANTPFRLSHSYNHTLTIYGAVDSHDDSASNALDGVTERLRNLNTHHDDLRITSKAAPDSFPLAASQQQNPPHQPRQLGSSTFPPFTNLENAHDSRKTARPPFAVTRTTSDDIFNELGYLGGCII
ncbi:hypothetical protein LTR62_008033 [Meristemomyces frigidus]|uniref:Uncharacterized protein n=1 Tax=Meristemomyces frigidus TaxID=1508187 RepID=A0AAN7TGZ8_9PEZI|nr:hypothetical protein LTR62_008033 [Meristemomyces frigidus]